MDVQFETLREMIWACPTFQAAVKDSSNSNPQIQEHIHGYASLEEHHNKFPRVSIRVAGWGTDFFNGACNENSSLRMAVDLQRNIPAKTPQGLEDEYKVAMKFFRGLSNELVRMSVDGVGAPGNYLGNLEVKIPDGIYLDDTAENEIVDPESETEIQQVVWWGEVIVTPQIG